MDLTDSSERVAALKRELAAAKAREDRLRALVDGSADLVVTVDRAGLITSTNPTLLLALDCEEEAVLGCSLSTLFGGPDADEVEGWVDARYQHVVDQELRLDNGRVVSVTATSCTDGDTWIVMRDITARARLERELSQARRLASVGRLAAGVAHAINNPLTVVQLRLEFLETLELNGEASGQITVVADHVRRIAGIVHALQTFARPQTQRDRHTDLSRLLREAREGLPAARVTLVVPAGLSVRGDPDRLGQVFTTLLSAAGEASGSREVVVRGEDRDGTVIVTIDDSGPPIPQDQLEELFTPFVDDRATTGAGLAMAIAWAIVREHEGTISATNRPGGGARYTVALPAMARQAGDTPEISRRRTPRILRLLCVDDEPALVEVVTAFASSVGHQVVAAGTAEAALELLATDTFDAVLTDQRLPGMDGRDLLAVVHQRHPELVGHTILMSGHFQSPGPSIRYLHKPFTRHQLLSILDEVGE